MIRISRLGTAVAALALGTATGWAQAPVNKVPIMAVTGCVTESGGTWTLANATEPTPSIANAPPAGEAIKGPTSGKNEYRLIGVGEFDMPSHKGHTVLVKGLFIKAAPMSRVNVTSVTTVSNTCAAAGK